MVRAPQPRVEVIVEERIGALDYLQFCQSLCGSPAFQKQDATPIKCLRPLRVQRERRVDVLERLRKVADLAAGSGSVVVEGRHGTCVRAAGIFLDAFCVRPDGLVQPALPVRSVAAGLGAIQVAHGVDELLGELVLGVLLQPTLQLQFCVGVPSQTDECATPQETEFGVVGTVLQQIASYLQGLLRERGGALGVTAGPRAQEDRALALERVTPAEQCLGEPSPQAGAQRRRELGLASELRDDLPQVLQCGWVRRVLREPTKTSGRVPLEALLFQLLYGLQRLVEPVQHEQHPPLALQSLQVASIPPQRGPRVAQRLVPPSQHHVGRRAVRVQHRRGRQLDRRTVQLCGTLVVPGLVSLGALLAQRECLLGNVGLAPLCEHALRLESCRAAGVELGQALLSTPGRR
mmetsp:Transcript_56944/g.158551  ORF Transcript_56944/g.158551 Transcript_56944/m.158551 type:complete len:405 (+) Transcript_56944:42-1256(+)